MFKKMIIFPIILFVVIILFNNFKSYDMTSKTVMSNNDLAISIDGVSSENLPVTGNYYLTKYKCYSNNTKVSWDRKNYRLNITNKNKKAGVSCNLTFKSMPYLSEMKEGSYVKYQGKGGFVGSNNTSCKVNGSYTANVETDDIESFNSCLGSNAREEVNDIGVFGYCYNSNYKYYTKGWRIAYINKEGKRDKAVIVSAGGLECVSSNDNNVFNTKALKYCNIDYVDNGCRCDDLDKNGICDSSSKDVWNINDNDFEKILVSSKFNNKKNEFSLSSCLNNKSMISCGYNNDLIDNGGYYWFNSNNNSYWDPDNRGVFTGNVRSYGLRPLVELSSSVVVVDGDGTIDNPYILSNNVFTINNGNEYTNSKDVTLNIVGSNAVSMCISNSSKCDEYVDFSNNVSWKLSDKDGVKKVYVYLKDSRGRLLAGLNKKIILDTIGPMNNKLEVIDKTANKIVLGINSNGAELMCINLSDDINKCDWIPYGNKYDVLFDKNDGVKTIYSFFKDKAGNVSTKSLTYNCETCDKAFTASYSFDGIKSVDEINKEKYINIVSDGNYSWKIDGVNKYFCSTNMGMNSTISKSIIKIKPTASANLSFEYGVSSEANYDKLKISINDNVLVNYVSGTVVDKIVNYKLEADKEYKLVLEYIKDSKGNVGRDIGYIKNLVIK